MELTKEQFEELKKTELEYKRIIEEKAKNETDAIKAAEMKKVVADIMAQIHPPEKKIIFTSKADRPDKEAIYKGFGDFLLAVKNGDQRVKTVMSTTSGQGGYTIPEEWMKEILNELNEASEVLPFCRPVSISAPTLHGNSLLTDLTVAWSTQATDKTTTKPTFSQSDLTLRFLYAILTATKEFTLNTLLDLEFFLKDLVAQNIANELEQEVLEGTTFTGLSTATGVNNVPQAAANLAYSDLTAAINNTGQLRQYKKKARWALTLGVLDIIMNLKDGNNRPLWSLNEPLNSEAPSTIMGYPYSISNQIADTISTGGTSTMYFGDFQNAWIGSKKGMEEMSVLYSETAVVSSGTSVSENAFTENKDMWRFEVYKGIYIAVPAAFVKLTLIK
jgi:HK97 family phage major capsid protein